jgi:hypothetical protein
MTAMLTMGRAQQLTEENGIHQTCLSLSHSLIIITISEMAGDQKFSCQVTFFTKLMNKQYIQ